MIETLTQFVELANDNAVVRQIAESWNIDIQIFAIDSKQAWTIEVRDGELRDLPYLTSSGSLAPASVAGETPRVLLEGESQLLEQLFRGQENPVRAGVHGKLATYGDMDDQARLDAIALILWGP